MSYERFARQYRFEPPSGFPLTLPCTSIVHHLSGPSIYAHARHRARMPQRAARGAPQRVLPIFELSPHSGFNHPSTCAHVRLLGPCFKTGRIAPEWHTILNRQLPWKLGRMRASTQNVASGNPRGLSLMGDPRCTIHDDGVGQVRKFETQRATGTIRLLPTISRTVSLSFQSPFHLSLTVLVRYRSPTNI